MSSREQPDATVEPDAVDRHEVAPRYLDALSPPDGLSAMESVVRKSGHSTDTWPEIQPWSQPKKNINPPVISF